MEYFWKELSKQIGPIPTTVQVALEQTQFIHAGLGYLDDTTIDYIEADIRRLPVLLNKPENDVANLLEYNGNIKEFRFLASERCIIKTIAKKIGEYGFLTFFQPQGNFTESSLTTMTKPVIANVSEIIAEVKAKIYSYYDQRRGDCDVEEPFFERLSDLEVEIRKDYLGDVASIICPFCDPHPATAVLIRRDRTGTWKVSNFSGHINTRHDDLQFPGKDRFGRKGARKRTYHEANRRYIFQTIDLTD